MTPNGSDSNLRTVMKFMFSLFRQVIKIATYALGAIALCTEPSRVVKTTRGGGVLESPSSMYVEVFGIIGAFRAIYSAHSVS